MSHCSFSIGFLNMRTVWLMSSFETPSVPITIFMGSLRISLHRSWTLFLKVAENRRVYLSGLIWPMMERT